MATTPNIVTLYEISVMLLPTMQKAEIRPVFYEFTGKRYQAVKSQDATFNRIYLKPEEVDTRKNLSNVEIRLTEWNSIFWVVSKYPEQALKEAIVAVGQQLAYKERQITDLKARYETLSKS